MKFIKLTYVDAYTGIPLNVEHATTGPAIPKGIVPTFDISSTRSQQAPAVYGIAEEDFNVPEWCYELPEDAFFLTFKNELKDRAKQKRKQLLSLSIKLDGNYFYTSDEDKLNSLYSTMTAIKSTDKIDFFTGGSWVEMSKADIKEALSALHKHSQKCFSWQKEFCTRVDELELSLENMECVSPLLEELNTYGG
jgi:hypothetical protein